MQNMYETIRAGLYFNKFEIDDLLFVEYKCPLEDELFGIWAQSDYLIHILSGKKTWRTSQGSWTAEKGQTLFIKKGGAIVEQFFDEEFCILMFFISDNFIRDVVREVSGQMDVRPMDTEARAPVITVQNDIVLTAYFQSMTTYFNGSITPTHTLLALKLKELIINILTGPNNLPLASYFQSLGGTEKTSLPQVMEANFCYNLSLEEFAKLCNRSLSSFKRDFKKHYRISPGKWLLKKRLEYAAVLLKNSSDNITRIVFDCGFEDLSHFSKTFKARFGVSPLSFRKEKTA